MKQFNIPATLLIKAASASGWQVGGVASAYLRDLDNEAITPDAVREAIPGFMACRGPDGIRGGPLHLHHGFWDGFLRRAIQVLGISPEKQLELVAGISLPLGRVTDIYVDDRGVTHWSGILSAANPISKVIWELLKEKIISLGVSLGGKILSTRRGCDSLGQPCTLIDKIRMDELSITANPALRLTQSEDPSNGAYITALSKAISASIEDPMERVEAFLTKALSPTKARQNGSATQSMGSAQAFNSGDNQLSTGMDGSLSTAPQKRAVRGTHHGEMQPDVTPGVGKTKNPFHADQSRGGADIKTDVWGMTVPQFASALKKCAVMDVNEFASPDTLTLFQSGAEGLAGLDPNPPMSLVNFVRLLQQISMYSQNLHKMSKWQQEGTLSEMKKSLAKGLMNFEESMPKNLMTKPFRPPGSPNVHSIQIPFPQQYRQH